MNLKPLVIYHGNCADGFTAAWCFHNMEDYDTSFIFHAGVYNDPPPDCAGRVIYLVDFSYKREVVKQICAVAKHVWLIDHHKTAIEDLRCLTDKDSPEYQDNFDWYVDTERSGARLAWDFIHNRLHSDSQYTPPPLLLEYVEDRDLWKFKLTSSRQVSAAVFSHEYSFGLWDTLMSRSIVEMVVDGNAIERKHHKDIKELLAVCQYQANIKGYVVPVANLPYTLASDACHIMAKAYQEGTLFAASYYDTEDKRVFSLRSTPEGLDVSTIAAYYGGGGHQHAAGFSVPKNHPLARI